jgi:hypothetical protein
MYEFGHSETSVIFVKDATRILPKSANRKVFYSQLLVLYRRDSSRGESNVSLFNTWLLIEQLRLQVANSFRSYSSRKTPLHSSVRDPDRNRGLFRKTNSYIVNQGYIIKARNKEIHRGFSNLLLGIIVGGFHL